MITKLHIFLDVFTMKEMGMEECNNKSHMRKLEKKP